MRHHLLALATLGAAAALSALLGWWFAATEHVTVLHGMFCAAGNAVTVGGDCAMRGRGYLIAFTEFCTTLPLFAGSVAFFTAWLIARGTAGHRRIALDTYRAVTGDDHPLAPGEDRSDGSN